MKKLRSSSVSTLFGSAGCQKLGQPVPDSYFVSESNSGAPQHTQVYIPFSLLFQYFPVKAGSVPLLRVTSYCSGVKFSRHSFSDFATFSFSVFIKDWIRQHAI